MGVQSKEARRSVSDWTASYRHFTDRIPQHRGVTPLSKAYIARGQTAFLRQQEIVGRLESTGGRRQFRDRQHLRALLHQMERRLEVTHHDRDWLQDQLR